MGLNEIILKEYVDRGKKREQSNKPQRIMVFWDWDWAVKKSAKEREIKQPVRLKETWNGMCHRKENTSRGRKLNTAESSSQVRA